MARISAVFSGRSNFELRLDVTEKSTNRDNNESVVTAYLYIYVLSTGTSNDFSGTSYYSVTVNGTTWDGYYNYDFSGKPVGYDLGLWALDITVPHNSDGTKTVAFDCYSDAASPLLSANPAPGTLDLTTFYFFGKRATSTSTWVTNTTGKRWNGSAWVTLTTAKMWNGSAWVNFS
jgi:hypothetical protein